ncbi:MAG: PQQ-binding-like beta-propeller repeat protein [Solirubrobacteraceae bacterium]
MPSSSRQVRRAEARRAQAKKATRSSQGGSGGPDLREKVPKLSKAAWLTVGAVVLAVVVVIAVVSLSSSSSSSSESSLLTGSGYPNGNTSNTRYAQSTINSGNVSQLQPAWTLPLTAKSQYGSYSASPIIAGGAMFSQDLASNVQAINLKTGKVIWTKSFESPDQGPNGLVVAGGRVYGTTATAAFALDEKTGQQLWSVTLTRNEHEGIDMAPGYHNGIVYVSTVPGNNEKFYGAGGVGILWALEANTGKKLWHFATAPESLWGQESVNAGGGLWYTPAFDNEGNMYVGTANPAPFPGTESSPWGSSRPGPNLYTDSIVKLNAQTGKVVWHYQQTPHDLYDWDLQDPPILAEVKGRKEVLASGKSGWVIALDTHSGKVLWKRSVGIHNGHDNDGVYAMKHEYSKLSLPETVYPGLLGGVIAPMSTNGTSVFVPIVNHPVTFNNQTEPQENGPSTGEVVALDLATGAVRWTRKFPTAVFGATTAVNDVVFATTFEGALYAFDANTGNVLWETKLPAATNTGVVASGDMLIAPAGLAAGNGQTPQIVAYRNGAG